MTVTYTGEVATCRGFGCFLKLLFRWKGSIYKLVWLDVLTFLSAYYVLNITYRWILNEHGKKIFEGVVHYCHKYSNLIPLSFVLGFYVSIVMTRWWNQYTIIPRTDSIAVYISAHVHGQDEHGRLMRRTAMRYVCLALGMVLSMVAPRVKKRFPTLDHFVEAGLLLENEKAIITDLNQKFPKHSKHWLPVVWSASIISRARKEGRIRDDFAAKTIIDELNKFRGNCGLLMSYDTISIPLVYTQVVTLAVYSYFLTAVMARQWIENRPNSKSTSSIDIYFPIFTMLEFFFYMGWLKVAESLINPFGEDDDDFEVNWMIDKSVQMAYLIVDEMHHEHPELIRDQYWDEVFPTELPYTIATESNREEHPLPSTAKIEVPTHQQGIIKVASTIIKIDDTDSRKRAVSYKLTPSEQTMTEEEAVTVRPKSFRRRTTSNGSSISHASMHPPMPPSIQKVAAVTQRIRRLFSREGNVNRQDSDPGTSATGKSGNIPKIASLVIDELDEQNTITNSVKDLPKPSIESVFIPPNPFGIPTTSKKTVIDQLQIDDDAATISSSCSSSYRKEDGFDRLKNIREKEKIEKYKQKILEADVASSSEDIFVRERPKKPDDDTNKDGNADEADKS